MKLYIAGPMSGIPQFNYPAFIAAAEVLREDGYEVLNPAEMDDEETKEAAMASPDGDLVGFSTGETWGDFLSRDVKIVADECDGVVLLPNWHTSRGARLEAFIAYSVQKPVYELWGNKAIELKPLEGARLIAKYVTEQGDTSRYGE
jgi:hypothetical protein